MSSAKFIDFVSKQPAKDLEALSQAAEAAERYDDMVVIMKRLVEHKLKEEQELTQDDRNLLSVAYKNVVGAKRTAWRQMNEKPHLYISKDDTTLSEDDLTKLAKKYQEQIENELKDVCQEVLDILVKLSNASEEAFKKVDANDANAKTAKAEENVFFLKMIGDYYRYLTEAFSSNDDYKKKCSDYYQKALEHAKEHLEATHPTRLGLALNFSVCYYEILDKQQEACKLAKEAFDEAIEKLDSLNDSSYKDSTLIMQLLRDNLTIWSQNNGQDKEDPPADS